MSLIPYAGRDPTEKQVAAYRWPERATARKSAPTPAKIVIKPSPRKIRLEAENPMGIEALASRGMPKWAREIVGQVSSRTGISVTMIAGARRSYDVVRARNEAIYLIKDRKPMLSSPLIGRWFNKDHVSILYSIASHSERTGAPKLVGYDLNRARRRKATFEWKRQQERAAA